MQMKKLSKVLSIVFGIILVFGYFIIIHFHKSSIGDMIMLAIFFIFAQILMIVPYIMYKIDA
jgi:hypothetical protein